MDIKLDIEILGTGCLSCNKLYEVAKESVEAAGLSDAARVTKVEDLQRLMELGVMTTPGLVINDRLISAGKVYKKNDLIALFLSEAEK